MNVLFASPEVAPFAKTGGLADVAESLPKALCEISCRVKVILPFYKSVKKMGLELTPFSLGGFNFMKYGDKGMEYLFVVNDEYYDRDNLYSEPGGDYPDNDMRFSYFSKAIVSLVDFPGFRPDIIHCNDWETGLVSLYLKIRGEKVKTLFTIHNIGYQGLFKRSALKEIGIPHRFYNINGVEYYGKISFLKAGIVYSSAVSTVSKGYAREILTPEFGCGMNGILARRSSLLYGIVNGVNYSQWDPAVDGHIAIKYGPESIAKKEDCKKDLIKNAGLPKNAEKKPLFGIISRLAEQKGIDLLVEAARDLVDLGANLIILGTGDEKYNRLCENIARHYPEHISSHIKFDNELAHKIEAGCDMFMMPSRYEPCGLNQLYSLRYGTLPVVRATGGLDDTIIDLYEDRQNGNGIKFRDATRKDLLEAAGRAIALYRKKERWHEILKRIMKLDFSWKASARHYKELYSLLIQGKS